MNLFSLMQSISELDDGDKGQVNEAQSQSLSPHSLAFSMAYLHIYRRLGWNDESGIYLDWQFVTNSTFIQFAGSFESYYFCFYSYKHVSQLVKCNSTVSLLFDC